MDGKMNNEPVAIVNTNCENNIQWYDDNPKQHNGYFLYTHPADTIPYKDLHQMVKNVLAHPVKELTDEEINVVAILQDAEIVPVGHEIWKTGEEFNKYKRIVLATAKALRKAQEK